MDNVCLASPRTYSRRIIRIFLLSGKWIGSLLFFSSCGQGFFFSEHMIHHNAALIYLARPCCKHPACSLHRMHLRFEEVTRFRDVHPRQGSRIILADSYIMDGPIIYVQYNTYLKYPVLAVPTESDAVNILEMGYFIDHRNALHPTLIFSGVE